MHPQNTIVLESGQTRDLNKVTSLKVNGCTLPLPFSSSQAFLENSSDSLEVESSSGLEVENSGDEVEYCASKLQNLPPQVSNNQT